MSITSRLFDPLAIGHLEIRNRLAIAPMTRAMALLVASVLVASVKC